MMELFVPRLGKARITSIKEPGINEQKVNTNFPRITALLLTSLTRQSWELGARGREVISQAGVTYKYSSPSTFYIYSYECRKNSIQNMKASPYEYPVCNVFTAPLQSVLLCMHNHDPTPPANTQHMRTGNTRLTLLQHSLHSSTSCHVVSPMNWVRMGPFWSYVVAFLPHV